MLPKPTQRYFSIVLAGALFLGNVAFVHSAESTFWNDRRRVSNARGVRDNGALLASAAAMGLPGELTSLPSLQSAPLGRPSPDLGQRFRRGENPQASARLASLLESVSLAVGRVRRLHIPKGSAPPLVVHVQDVHLNLEAQKNIATIIEGLTGPGKASLVALEGAFGPMDVGRFAAYPDPGTLRIVADDMLLKNEIPGPVFEAMVRGTGSTRFVGVDDRDRHARNVDAYRRSLGRVSECQSELGRRQTQNAREKAEHYHPLLLAFDQRVEAYRNHRVPLGDHLAFLSESAAPGPDTERFLAARRMEKAIDFDGAERERGVVIGELTGRLDEARRKDLLAAAVAYRGGQIRTGAFYRVLDQLCRAASVDVSRFASLRAYINYVFLADRVNAQGLYEDLARMEREGYARLAKSETDRRLTRDSKGLFLVSKLLDFSMTAAEWVEYRQGVRSFPLPLDSFEDFYREAESRNEALVDNLLSAMDQAGASASVLVAGGFHSDGVEALLERRGVAFVTLTPQVTRVDPQLGGGSLTVFAREKAPLERIFEGEKLFVAKEVNLPQIRFSAAVQAEAAGRLPPGEAVQWLIPEAQSKIQTLRRQASNLFTRVVIRFSSGRELVVEDRPSASPRLSAREEGIPLSVRLNPVRILKENAVFLVPIAAVLTGELLGGEPHSPASVTAWGRDAWLAGIGLVLAARVHLLSHAAADYRGQLRRRFNILRTPDQITRRLLGGYVLNAAFILPGWFAAFHLFQSLLPPAGPLLLVLEGLLAAAVALGPLGWFSHGVVVNVLYSPDVPGMADLSPGGKEPSPPVPLRYELHGKVAERFRTARSEWKAALKKLAPEWLPFSRTVRIGSGPAAIQLERDRRSLTLRIPEEDLESPDVFENRAKGLAERLRERLASPLGERLIGIPVAHMTAGDYPSELLNRLVAANPGIKLTLIEEVAGWLHGRELGNLFRRDPPGYLNGLFAAPPGAHPTSGSAFVANGKRKGWWDKLFSHLEQRGLAVRAERDRALMQMGVGGTPGGQTGKTFNQAQRDWLARHYDRARPVRERIFPDSELMHWQETWLTVRPWGDAPWSMLGTQGAEALKIVLERQFEAQSLEAKSAVLRNARLAARLRKMPIHPDVLGVVIMGAAHFLDLPKDLIVPATSHSAGQAGEGTGRDFLLSIFSLPSGRLYASLVAEFSKEFASPSEDDLKPFSPRVVRLMDHRPPMTPERRRWLLEKVLTIWANRVSGRAADFVGNERGILQLESLLHQIVDRVPDRVLEAWLEVGFLERKSGPRALWTSLMFEAQRLKLQSALAQALPPEALGIPPQTATPEEPPSNGGGDPLTPREARGWAVSLTLAAATATVALLAAGAWTGAVPDIGWVIPLFAPGISLGGLTILMQGRGVHITAGPLRGFLGRARLDARTTFMEVVNGELRLNPQAAARLSRWPLGVQNAVVYGLGVVAHESLHLSGIRSERIAYGAGQILPAFLGAGVGIAVLSLAGAPTLAAGLLGLLGAPLATALVGAGLDWRVGRLETDRRAQAMVAGLLETGAGKTAAMDLNDILRKRPMNLGLDGLLPDRTVALFRKNDDFERALQRAVRDRGLSMSPGEAQGLLVRSALAGTAPIPPAPSGREERPLEVILVSESMAPNLETEVGRILSVKEATVRIALIALDEAGQAAIARLARDPRVERWDQPLFRASPLSAWNLGEVESLVESRISLTQFSVCRLQAAADAPLSNAGLVSDLFLNATVLLLDGLVPLALTLDDLGRLERIARLIATAA